MNMRIRFMAVAASALFAVPSVCLAGGIGLPPDCVMDLLFAGRIADLGLARVTAPKVRFQQDGGDCPGPASCLLKPYVVKGDLVVTGRRHGAWICVLYPNNFLNEGWVPLSSVSPVPVKPTRAPADWTGRWVRDPQARLKITSLGGVMLRADGDAYWVGSTPDTVHYGEVHGRGQPKGDYLSIPDKGTEGACKPTFRRIGPYMAGFDDNQCGGLNVTFTGVYRRK